MHSTIWTSITCVHVLSWFDVFTKNIITRSKFLETTACAIEMKGMPLNSWVSRCFVVWFWYRSISDLKCQSWGECMASWCGSMPELGSRLEVHLRGAISSERVANCLFWQNWPFVCRHCQSKDGLSRVQPSTRQILSPCAYVNRCAKLLGRSQTLSRQSARIHELLHRNEQQTVPVSWAKLSRFFLGATDFDDFHGRCLTKDIASEEVMLQLFH